MEDYIYILGGIAYVAYMIYSSFAKQKKQEEQKKKAKMEAEPQSFTEAEEEFYQEKSSAQEEVTSVIDEFLGFPNFEEELNEDLYREFNYSSKPLDSIPEEEGVATTVKEEKPADKKYESIIVSKEESILKEEEDEVGEETVFNLRDAVIASEILNPKYIKY